MSLPTAPLGRNGPLVNRIGFGLMGLSTFYGPKKSDRDRLALLDQAYQMGERVWDTADGYGDSEDLLHMWFTANPEKRKDIFLATKFAGRPDMKFDSSPEYCKKACAASLERLGVSHIDLYYCHRLDRKTPIEKTVQAMAELQSEGKIRYLGLSECSSRSLRRAHAVHPITAVQMEYSPFALEIESDQFHLLKTCRELGVATVAYSPLGRGIFTGTIKSPDDFDETDTRRFMPKYTKENFHHTLDLADKLVALAKKKGVTSGQLVLAWLLAQGQDIFPIPGTTNVERLRENTGATRVVLSQEEEKEIRDACEKADVRGQRYPEGMNEANFADTPEL